MGKCGGAELVTGKADADSAVTSRREAIFTIHDSSPITLPAAKRKISNYPIFEIRSQITRRFSDHPASATFCLADHPTRRNVVSRFLGETRAGRMIDDELALLLHERADWNLVEGEQLGRDEVAPAGVSSGPGMLEACGGGRG